jgi:predicted TIM-barrel fold metal-dependent hydrolase
MIASLRSDVSPTELDRMHKAGVRGVRYTIGHAGAAPIAEMPELAKRIAEFGWHVQLHVMNDGSGNALVEMEKALENLATDLVIDHIGSIHPVGGLGQRGFAALLRLLETGRCWVKLSGAYRVSKAPPYEDMMPFVEKLVAANPDRLVWGSDWPHVAFKGSMPDTTDLLDQLLAWIPDATQRHRILVDNPATLYGF